MEEGYVKASVDGRLKGAHIVMDKVSVGATRLPSCAPQPWRKAPRLLKTQRVNREIVDTANFLITLGAKISGQGTASS